MIDGIINLDTDFAKEIGFTSDRFMAGISYLWKSGNRIIISAIESKQEGKGYFRNLLENIEKRGYEIAVPTPFARMKDICLRNGFEERIEWFEGADDYGEILVKPAKEKTKFPT